MKQDKYTYDDKSLRIKSGSSIVDGSGKDRFEAIGADIQYSGHLLVTEGGEIRCVECGKTEEVPDLIEQSGSFVQVVYKLYKIKKFEQCLCVQDDSGSDTRTSPIVDEKPGNTIIPPKRNIHWSSTHATSDVKIDGMESK